MSDDTIVLPSARLRIAIPRCRAEPFAERPTPPAVGEAKTIDGYEITAKICKGANGDKPIYYLRSSSGEILSVAYDWDRWCHCLGWYPLQGLAAGEAIPREIQVADKPTRPTGPYVVNRHHFQSRDEIPEPWIYVGRGSPLGNPFVVEDVGIKRAIEGYRQWLWKRISHRDPGVLAELGKITAQTHLVCSCAPRPCHADTIIKAWKWAKSRSVLDGYRRDPNEAEPDWATEIEAEVPVIERRDTQTLDMFGGES